MTVRVFALSLLWAASLYGQRMAPHSWEDACFKNPAAPYCPGHDYAVKPPPKNAKVPPSSSSNVRSATPSHIVPGAIDWRFAEPFADTLIRLNLNAFASSPLARNLVLDLGANHGLTETDLHKLFDTLSGFDQVAISVRGNQIVAMATGRVADSPLPQLAPDLKAMPLSGTAILIGHSGLLDQAAQRIAMKVPLTELAQWADQQQTTEIGATSDLWATGSARFIGPDAVLDGVKRFSLAVSIGDTLTGDLSLEFNGTPSAKTLDSWRTKLGATTLEGNSLHSRMPAGGIAASPLGQPLADLLGAAHYLPAPPPDPTAVKPPRPVIYGLDSGPREVTQDSSRSRSSR